MPSPSPPDCASAACALSFTENKKFKAKMNYADKTKIPYVLFLGEDEVSSGVVTCKDMVTGEQTKGAPDEIIARIYAAIREKNAQKVIVEKVTSRAASPAVWAKCAISPIFSRFFGVRHSLTPFYSRFFTFSIFHFCIVCAI